MSVPGDGSIVPSTYTVSFPITNQQQYHSLLHSGDSSPSSSRLLSSQPARTSSPAAATAGTSSTGLSTGAQIGIGVGMGLGGLLVIVVAGFLLIKRRRRSTGNRGFEKPELQGRGLSRTHGRKELEEGRPPAELDASTDAKELPGDQGYVAELKSDAKTETTSTTMNDNDSIQK